MQCVALLNVCFWWILSGGHTIATTSRRPMTTDDHRQPITDQIFDRQSVADQLQTSRRPTANHSAIGRRLNFESSLKFENQSTTGCHKINDWSATIRRLTARITKEVLMLCINLSHPLFPNAQEGFLGQNLNLFSEKKL